jgi:hypothetical protein
VDGVIAIAPGGNVGAGLLHDRLADTVASARSLLAAGHGEEKPGWRTLKAARAVSGHHHARAFIWTGSTRTVP